MRPMNGSQITFFDLFSDSTSTAAGAVGRVRLLDPTGGHETQRCDRQIMTSVP